ncbi:MULTISPECIES: hypothetical protein [Halorussus]|uniref:hypothetical protein n=1 Tax=Halorussus TaxID=1070314 RepID=UPI000E20D867|nr:MULTISPECIES: hypothetical protein [Halorussus]NHN59465.1 hypothetical protein [Halorussus sp. JP-T4]
MNPTTIRIRKRRYDGLADAVAGLLASYGVAEPPDEDFDVETLAGAGAFEEFDVLRDLAVRLGEGEPVERDGEAFVEVEVSAHHLVAATAALPDLVAASDLPEPELRVVVEGLCQEYLLARSGQSRDGGG